jgi:hypothetical protein
MGRAIASAGVQKKICALMKKPLSMLKVSSGNIILFGSILEMALLNMKAKKSRNGSSPVPPQMKT